MEYKLLPPVEKDSVYPLPPYFPNRMYMAIFRLWDTVPAEKIASAIDLPLEVVLNAADKMGLPTQAQMDNWRIRGIITIIKSAWHTLPYEQLLKLLDMNEQELAFALKEEDFLGVKLGFKPFCEPIVNEPLSNEQEEKLVKIKNIMTNEFSEMFSGAEPFVFFDEKETSGEVADFSATKELRLCYSYCGLYATVLDNDIKMSYPEQLLKKYQEMGVNAVWLPVVLYQITPFPFDESYSVGWEKRLDRLKELVALASKYSIKVYLYLNEPRSMETRFFDKYPKLKGSTEGAYTALCTSDERVLEYLKNAVVTVCKEVEGLGGFFLITASENLTHCKSRGSLTTSCPKCENTPIYETIAKIVTTVYEAATSVSEDIRTIAWTWAWQGYMSREEIAKCIDGIPKEVIIQSVSESKKKFNIAGIEGVIGDYSMSIPGPADLACFIWEYARSKGHEVCAKVQVNVTWECSTMPFLPVFDLIREHMIGLRNVDVQHLMLCWTLGGYPSINLKVASECLKNPEESAFDELLRKEYGEYAQTIKKASRLFSEAFREFPFHIQTLYKGPQNLGPANLLYEEPLEKYGFQPTMTCFAYDNLEVWRSIYPVQTYINQLKKLSDIWRDGLKLIEDLPDSDFKQAAYGGYLLFYSSYLQSEFIYNRDKGDREYLKTLVEAERDNAKDMYELMLKNSTIGFEAANHYYFYKSRLAEKVICCDYLKSKYEVK